MSTSSIIWLVVAVVVLVAVIAVVAALVKRRQDRDRARASELREQAMTEAGGIERHEAAARETEARAAQSRAAAERLEAEAADRRSTLEEHRGKHQDHLRRADELDPDVDHPAPTTAPQDTTASEEPANAPDDQQSEGGDERRSPGARSG